MTDSSGGEGRATDRLRLRRTVQRWFVPIVAVLLVVAALGAGTVYATHIEPGETTEERVVSTWSDRAEFSHSAVVQRDTAAFSNDVVLRNRPAYYTRVSPDATLEYASGYTASDGGNLDVETVLKIRWEGTDGDGNALWRVTEPVATSTWTDVAPDETRRVETTFNATEVNDRIATFQEELGSSRGSVKTVFVAQTSRSGEINGQSVQHSRTHSIPLDHRESTYGFSEPSIETVSRERTKTETVPADYGPIREAGSVLLTVVPLLGALGMTLARRKRVFELSDEENAALEHALAREEFDEWITTGTLPTSLSKSEPVEVASFEGVVNVAIDSGRRVIEDGDRYFISTPELSYLYVNDAPSIESVSASTEPDLSTDDGYDEADGEFDPAGNGQTAASVAATEEDAAEENVTTEPSQARGVDDDHDER